MELLIFLGSLLLLWNFYLIAREFYKIAVQKGHPQKKYLWISFFCTYIGYLLVIALPDRGEAQKTISDELPDL